GQWLPLDPPGAQRATLGGVAATGAGGAQTLGYGTPRSYVLGMRVALADGRIIRAGGRVVKNVAGYDLCKLFVGSRGTLGLILELTFKLRPRPAREATVASVSKDLPRLFAAARALAASQLFPVAVEVVSPRMSSALPLPFDGGGFVLLARFAGTEGAVAYQVERARELAGEHGLAGVDVFEEDGALWQALAAASAGDGNGLAWHASVLPSELGAFVERLCDERGDGAAWHAGAGDGRLRVFESGEGDCAEAASSLRSLREAARRACGSLVVERAPRELRAGFDVWGLGESAAFLMRRVKEQLDPADTFSPGRF
nr:FAD-binding oxidoreductase [Acidobacteriota bacterium]